MKARNIHYHFRYYENHKAIQYLLFSFIKFQDIIYYYYNKNNAKVLKLDIMKLSSV